MKITFFGAARGVTGSCHMIEAAGKKFLVDCGLYQGTLTEQILNYEPFPFDVNDIDFVILSHAHIDHSGRIPKLFVNGYKNPVYATPATRDLCTVMLPDSGHIQEKEIEWVNRKRMRAGKKPEPPMYTAKDGLDSCNLIEPIDYGKIKVIDENISFKFIDAGHMLGSAIVEIWVKEGEKTEKIVFSGDLGNEENPIIRSPEHVEEADYLILESTYGDRLHGSIEDQSKEFIQIILDTIKRGGNVVIPSFAVGRTQEILFELNQYVSKNLDNGKYIEELANVPVVVDSPLAKNATEIFEDNFDCYNEEALSYLLTGDNPIGFKNLRFTASADESKAINDDPTPKIIISASGMCEAGRIKHHLKHNLWRPESTILFVGYQAEGTLGRRILSGEKTVKIFGEEIGVHAEIRKLNAFSGHADQNGLLNFIDGFTKKPKRIFLVHGEYEGQQVLAQVIKSRFGIDTVIPERSEKYYLGDDKFEKASYNLRETNLRLDIYEMLTYLKQDMDQVSKVVKFDVKQNITEEELFEIKVRLEGLRGEMNKIKNREKVEG
ncbi:MAG: MBL fold metallo-hydrolase [Clostridia bacterium]|nr:MBL fold metallo-hydrolase [Clostridia bacterium]